MKRLDDIFSCNKKSLMVQICCGAPDLNAFRGRVEAAIAAGADIIELAVPFSDPMSGTPDVQLAFQQAIANGANLQNILPVIKSLRQQYPAVGLILSGYCNVFLQYGIEKLFCELKMIGIDGILIGDLPYEERGEVEAFAGKYSVALLRTIGCRTGKARAEQICCAAQDFIYCEGKLPLEQLEELKTITSLPIAAATDSPATDIVILCENIAGISIDELSNKISQTRKSL